MTSILNYCILPKIADSVIISVHDDLSENVMQDVFFLSPFFLFIPFFLLDLPFKNILSYFFLWHVLACLMHERFACDTLWEIVCLTRLVRADLNPVLVRRAHRWLCYSFIVAEYTMTGITKTWPGGRTKTRRSRFLPRVVSSTISRYFYYITFRITV